MAECETILSVNTRPAKNHFVSSINALDFFLRLLVEAIALSAKAWLAILEAVLLPEYAEIANSGPARGPRARI